ncbi:MAG: hypothetical protein DHS20C15_10600 [Planctomycetota bacterium]|nr:MAG: hypothetical protein DHS20C15_10600 [Planctomycetota bacterium]
MVADSLRAAPGLLFCVAGGVTYAVDPARSYQALRVPSSEWFVALAESNGTVLPDELPDRAADIESLKRAGLLVAAEVSALRGALPGEDWTIDLAGLASVDVLAPALGEALDLLLARDRVSEVRGRVELQSPSRDSARLVELLAVCPQLPPTSRERDRLQVEVVTPHLDLPEELLTVLDDRCMSRVFTHDRSRDLSGDSTRSGWRLEEQLTRCQALKSEGFGVHVIVPVRGAEGDAALCQRWIDHGAQGLQLELATPATESQFVAAVQFFDALTAECVPLLSTSEPWRSILRTALSGKPQLRSGTLSLTSAGRWARSRDHARRGVYAPLEDLCDLPTERTRDLGPRSKLACDGGVDSWPECERCALMELCAGPVTEDVEALARAGDARGANYAARLACEMRTITLTALLRELVEAAVERRGVANSSFPVTAQVVQGRVHLETSEA